LTPQGSPIAQQSPNRLFRKRLERTRGKVMLQNLALPATLWFIAPAVPSPVKSKAKGLRGLLR
jgi:hypothetical protein